MERGSDAELVALARSGDEHAFARLYRAHAPAVAAAARSRLSSPDAVADVVQETFARALAHLDHLDDAERFRPWLLTIARNAATDEQRRARRVMVSPDVASDAPAPELGPEDRAELRDLVRSVRGIVAGLSRRDATALVMVAELGFGPTEVGTALGISPGAAKVVVHRARQRLRQAIAADKRASEKRLARSVNASAQAFDT